MRQLQLKWFIVFSGCLTDMGTVLSYWTATALGAYEMSLLTVEVKVFITRRRQPHSPSSGRGVTSLWDSRDGLRQHLFEVRFYCNWSCLPPLPQELRLEAHRRNFNSHGLPGVKHARPSRSRCKGSQLWTLHLQLSKARRGTRTWDN